MPAPSAALFGGLVDPASFDGYLLKRNDYVRTTSSHMNSLVDHNFVHNGYRSEVECRRRGAPCPKNEAENVNFWWSIPLLIGLIYPKSVVLLSPLSFFHTKRSFGGDAISYCL
jgi:hypothetical protein